MSYSEQQRRLFDKLEREFASGKRKAHNRGKHGPWKTDPRMALTSVTFVPPVIQKVIQKKIIMPLRAADPRHYFYPNPSLHLTIKNVRTSTYPPLYTKNDIVKAKTALQRVIKRYPAIHFKLQGLFRQPESLAIRGYCNSSLGRLVKALDRALNSAGVPDNKKYGSTKVFFGNVTICRFSGEPNQQFKAQIKNLQAVEVGNWAVQKVSLITTNIVCAPNKTTIWASFGLS